MGYRWACPFRPADSLDMGSDEAGAGPTAPEQGPGQGPVAQMEGQH